MSISSVHRSQKPIRFAMSLPSKVVEVVDKAVGGVEEADEVAQVAVPMAAYPKKKLTG
jgi:hypothetical protein